MKTWVALFLVGTSGLLCVAQGSKPLQLWTALKTQLTSARGEEFFRENLKDSALPVLVGTLISATPEDHPSVLLIGVSDRNAAEITVRLKDEKGSDAHLNGPLLRGSEVRFEAVPVAFSSAPFMLTMEASTALKPLRQRRN
jgi:hypothetical protein